MDFPTRKEEKKKRKRRKPANIFSQFQQVDINLPKSENAILSSKWFTQLIFTSLWILFREPKI